MRRARNMMARLLPLVLVPAATGGCYAYTYAPSTPAPGRTIAVDLNDRGRVALEQNVGPSIYTVEGVLESATDSALQLRVQRTIGLRGQSQRWSGESVTIRREFTGLLRERQFSTGRTVALAGSVAVGVGAFIAAGGFNVFGAGSPGNPPPVEPPGGT